MITLINEAVSDLRWFDGHPQTEKISRNTQLGIYGKYWRRTTK